MGLALEVFEDHDYGPGVASEVGAALRGARNIILTGGTTASAIYERITGVFEGASESLVFFSDERCVPPDHPASNYGLAKRVLLPAGGGPRVERMRGEEDPSREAARYDGLISAAIGEGLDLALLGMGADCHIAGLWGQVSCPRGRRHTLRGRGSPRRDERLDADSSALEGDPTSLASRPRERESGRGRTGRGGRRVASDVSGAGSSGASGGSDAAGSSGRLPTVTKGAALPRS